MSQRISQYDSNEVDALLRVYAETSTLGADLEMVKRTCQRFLALVTNRSYPNPLPLDHSNQDFMQAIGPDEYSTLHGSAHNVKKAQEKAGRLKRQLGDYSDIPAVQERLRLIGEAEGVMAAALEMVRL